MEPIPNNQDLACYYVTKHSWRGKYKRVFSIGTHGISTYDPMSLRVTNKWIYDDIIALKPAALDQNCDFTLHMRQKSSKPDTMKFSSGNWRSLLTDALRFTRFFFDKPRNICRFPAYKHHWSETRLPIELEITPYSLDQLDPTSKQVVASYDFINFEGVVQVSDCPGAFAVVYGGFGRLHLFSSPQSQQIIEKITETASTRLQLAIKVLENAMSVEDIKLQRLGKLSADEHLTSVAEFYVYKQTARHSEPPKRILCLTDSCLVERDFQTYSVCTLRPLYDIFALVRDDENAQLFSVEYVQGLTRSYTCTDRDSLLSSLLDAVRAAGNRDVHVKMRATPRGKRLGPLDSRLGDDNECQWVHVKYLNQTSASRAMEMIERFNANIPYSGLVYSPSQDSEIKQWIFRDNKEKLINGALETLVTKEMDKNDFTHADIEAQFQALRRLAASKVGFAALVSVNGFREAIGNKVILALRRANYAVTHAAIDMICAFMHPMHDDYDLRQEQLNKTTLLSSPKFLDSLLNMWIAHVTHGTGALVVLAMLDFLSFALCVPYSETTDGAHFDTLLEMVASRGRSIFKLFQHPSTAIVKNAGLIMRALIEEGDELVAERMRNLALAEGAMPRHLLNALYMSSVDGRLLANRQLSRHLIGLWVTGHNTAMSLLRRIMPPGLLAFLESMEDVPASALEQELLNNRNNLKIAQDDAVRMRRNPNLIALEKSLKNWEKHAQQALQHWSARVGIQMEKRREKLRDRPIVLRKRRERVKATANWPLFYYKFHMNHELPNLIWNHQTREELRNALDNEIRLFHADQELAGAALVAWNHQEFEVSYNCLQDEIKIGDYYLRLLLEMDTEESPIRKTYEFFNDLYHRYLLTGSVDMKCVCLQAMAIVYGRYFEDIGPFSDTRNVVQVLERCLHKSERDRLVIFLSKLINHKRNVKDVLEVNGVRVLVDLLTLAHLHTSRAALPAQSNVIEAGPNGMDQFGDGKEWYYMDEVEKKKKGLFSFKEMKDLVEKGQITTKTKCWAKNFEGWRTPYMIAQMKWCCFARGQCVMNESDLATCVLNIFIKMCQYFPSRDQDEAIIRPLPKVKRLLSDINCLSHIVQLLLTFDPIIVEKVATLLCELMRDNPEMSKLYLTGVFFFILMYTGSNVLPIAKFLELTHMKQAFRSDDCTSDIMQRSILGQLLPEAMLHYLENHGADKFAQIFLGEYDTPEVIWNNQMRHLLIQKIAAHIADFSPRLRSNTMARYEYMTFPAIRYPQLDNELFCNIFYLRHLCDTRKFPSWPIPDPIGLLKDVLEAWKREVEKKPASMTLTDAYRTLDLDPSEQHSETNVRKAYYRLANLYHPDKNPEGRERFLQIKQAHEFLCSRSCWVTDGTSNIVLILQTQSILFDRYSKELEPYKYAGYPQLIKTIQMETNDENLFSKTTPLLPAASELAYHTVHCSALNAEELRRERGLELLLDAYSRCVAILNRSSKPTEMSVLICHNITRCYAVAAQFSACRDRIVEMPQLVKDLCRILYFDHLTKLCANATECVSALAYDSLLQMQLLKAGALWRLLLFMFNYDYTLEEGGVDRSEDTNQQEVRNNLAKLAVHACARLGGYLTGDSQTPRNPIISDCLDSLLTPYVARQLRDNRPEIVLKLLNSNCETPYLIWDNSTRAELCEFVDTQSKHHTNDNIENGLQYVYSAHKNELVIGDIYVRVYNEQPTFTILEPETFAKHLLTYLNNETPYLTQLENVAYSTILELRVKRVLMTLEALANVIKHNVGSETQCIGHFRMLFKLLGVSNGEVQKSALDVILLVTRNNECVNDIAGSEVLMSLLLLLYYLPELQQVVLDTLNALLTTTKIIKEALARGAIIYLLDLFCNSQTTGVRQLCAELLARMAADKLNGPKVRLALEFFLPGVFLDAMRDQPVGSVQMFESEHEHPELIWNVECRTRIKRIVTQFRKEYQTQQLENANAIWKAPDANNQMCRNVANNEMVIAGVYVRLFVRNPSWTLRRPREFLAELMDAILNMMAKEKVETDRLELLTKTVCALLHAQPNLADAVPALGHIPRLTRQMQTRASADVYKSSLLVMHQLSLSEQCVHAISQTQCMEGIKKCMESRRDLIGVACETLNRLVSVQRHDELVHQAINANLIAYLLTLLESRLEFVDNPSTVKAQIVKALKAMANSQAYGSNVVGMLERSAVWAEYKHQKHDLFLSNVPVSGYLTGAPPTTAGYLTQGNGSNMFTAPPPCDDM